MVDELKKILELQTQTVADLPLNIPFDIIDRSMLPDDFPLEVERDERPDLSAINRLKNLFKKKQETPDKAIQARTELYIGMMKVSTVMRLQTLIRGIDREDLEKVSVTPDRPFDEGAPELFEKYTDLIVEIICTGLHNNKGPFPDYMPEFIRANCTWRDFHVLLNAITFRMGSMAFINSTTALMSVGPGAEEMIALQKNLMSWKDQNN